MIPKIIVITGPTATGKTALAVHLAKSFDGEVIGADSMQIYKYMDIGTAKPTVSEMAGIKHHMIDFIHPSDNYSVSRYIEDASACIKDVLNRGKLPIVVGGTGLYIEALISGKHFAPETSHSGLRSKLSQLYDSAGGIDMMRRLSEFDPESAKRLHINDKKRIVRAFEVYIATGKTITQFNEATKRIPPNYDACKIALNFSERCNLYNRIDQRVDVMFEQGLVKEVHTLLDMGINESCTSMQAIGYKEILEAFHGGISIEQAKESIKRESRRYAKRQISWIARDKNINWINWEKIPDFEFGLRISTDYLHNAGVI